MSRWRRARTRSPSSAGGGSRTDRSHGATRRARAGSKRPPSSAGRRRSPPAPPPTGLATAPTPHRADAQPSRSESIRRLPSRRGYPRVGPTRSTPLAAALAIDAERRPRPRFETFRRNLPPAVRAVAVRPVVDSQQRRIDLRQHVLRVFLERVVELAVVRDGGGVSEVVVVHRVLPGLVGDRTRVLLVEVVERRLDALPLLRQRFAEPVGVDRAHPCSFPAADASRRSVSVGSIPASSTILSLPPWPETSLTESGDKATAVAISRT